MSDQPACAHRRIAHKDVDGMVSPDQWECMYCETSFFPKPVVDTLLKSANDENDAMIEMITVTTADILYRVQQAIATGEKPTETYRKEKTAEAQPDDAPWPYLGTPE